MDAEDHKGRTVASELLLDLAPNDINPFGWTMCNSKGVQVDDG